MVIIGPCCLRQRVNAGTLFRAAQRIAGGLESRQRVAPIFLHCYEALYRTLQYSTVALISSAIHLSLRKTMTPYPTHAFIRKGEQ